MFLEMLTEEGVALARARYLIVNYMEAMAVQHISWETFIYGKSQLTY